MKISEVFRHWRDGKSCMEKANSNDIACASKILEEEEFRDAVDGLASSPALTQLRLDRCITIAEATERRHELRKQTRGK
jgi:hypothetical protein